MNCRADELRRQFIAAECKAVSMNCQAIHWRNKSPGGPGGGAPRFRRGSGRAQPHCMQRVRGAQCRRIAGDPGGRRSPPVLQDGLGGGRPPNCLNPLDNFTNNYDHRRNATPKQFIINITVVGVRLWVCNPKENISWTTAITTLSSLYTNSCPLAKNGQQPDKKDWVTGYSLRASWGITNTPLPRRVVSRPWKLILGPLPTCKTSIVVTATIFTLFKANIQRWRTCLACR